MRQNNQAIELYRIRNGQFASSPLDGNNGAFRVPHQSHNLSIIASDGMGWEHVSVSVKGRCPTWEEMCHIKNLFWDEDEVVIQYHPAKEDYVNNCEYCLHLWKPVDVELPTPPTILVGFK